MNPLRAGGNTRLFGLACVVTCHHVPSDGPPGARLLGRRVEDRSLARPAAGEESRGALDRVRVAHEYVFMRTSIDLPDDLFREAKARAARRGVPLRELVTNALRRELAMEAERAGSESVALPLVRSSRPGRVKLTNARIEEILA